MSADKILERGAATPPSMTLNPCLSGSLKKNIMKSKETSNMVRASILKVYIGLYFDTVVVAQAPNRDGAVNALRAKLSARHRREARSISLLNHVALVYWSDARQAFWYRLGAPCFIHPARVSEPLRASVAVREPDQDGWLTDTSAAAPP